MKGTDLLTAEESGIFTMSPENLCSIYSHLGINSDSVLNTN